MTFKRIGEFLKGYVTVEVRGKNPERLINLCLSSGFPIWDIVRHDDKVYFSISLSKYREIRTLARKSRCIPRIRKRYGFPFFLGKVKKRPAFVLSSALILAVLFYLSGFIWVIQVKGNDKVPRDLILEVAAGEGLKVGSRKAYVSEKSVEEALTLKIPRLSWAYVHFQGTLAVIEVVEKVRPEMAGPGDVVARKDGVVDSVLVLSGIPLVKPGQTVKKGEILIAGESGGGRQGARGNVTARTWYEVRQEIPLYRLEAVRTGKTMEITVLRLFGREITFSGMKRLFDWYEMEEYPVKAIGEGSRGPLIEVLTRVFFEVKWRPIEFSVEEAIALGEKRGRQVLERQLPSTAKVLGVTCDTEVHGSECVVVRLVASALEEIGELRPWPEQKNGGW